MIKNNKNCLEVWVGEKFRSWKVHTLFKKKFVTIDTSIPIKVACMYHKCDREPLEIAVDIK